MSFFQHYNLPFSEVFVFDEFLIAQINEGELITPEHNETLNEVIQKHFLGKDLVYISNRVNSYAVDPLAYVEAQKIPNLVAMAIIPRCETMRKSAEYEKDFYDKPYGIFNTLSEAIIWTHKILHEHKLNT